MYWGLMQFYTKNWDKVEHWEIPDGFLPKTSISILIPARNEAQNIKTCLETILNQNYPDALFEIIVIDDHSTDDTADLVLDFSDPRIHLIDLSAFVDRRKIQSFKKEAIEIGIKQAKGTLMLTTDADCEVPSNWLMIIASFFEAHSYHCIASPVNFHHEFSHLERFQSLDFLGMMLITGTGIKTRLMRMANGANLAYTKKVFETVNGFEGINHLASGDDMLLVQKIAAKYPNGIGFLKSKKATVHTKAKSSWEAFFRQRIRWATKSSSYREWQVTLILAIVFFFCSNIFLSILLSYWWGWPMIAIALLQLGIKILADYPFLTKACRFFHREELMQSFWFAQVMHIFYIVSIGILSNVIKQYYWKGRKVR